MPQGATEMKMVEPQNDPAIEQRNRPSTNSRNARLGNSIMIDVRRLQEEVWMRERETRNCKPNSRA